MENNNASDSEEEMYVVLELNDYEKADILSSTKKFSVVGLDTETPFLQLDDKVFKGEVESTLGTQIIFEEFLLTKEQLEQRDQQIEQERQRRQQLLQIQMQRKRLQNQIRAESGNIEDDDLDLGINQDELPEMEKNKSSISHVKLFCTSTKKIKFSRVVLEPKTSDSAATSPTVTPAKKRKNNPSKTSKSSSKKSKAASLSTNNANETNQPNNNNKSTSKDHQQWSPPS